MIIENTQEFFANIDQEAPILGLDIGQKRIGLAMSDPRQKIAFPKEVYERINMRQDIGYLNRVCKEQAVAGVVIGLPLGLNNEEENMCASIRSFAAKLFKKTQLPIIFIDERFSTSAVTKAMQEGDLKRKTRHQLDDKLAAAYLLQIVLDKKKA